MECDLLNIKPIVVYMSDGASDEAPRFLKAFQTRFALFQELKLDVLLHGVNTAGLLAFNPVSDK